MPPIGTTPPDTKSRYGTRMASEFSAVERMGPEDVAHVVADLRKTFRTEKTYSLEWRKNQLHQFMKMLNECEAEFCEGMKQDLHKSPFEGFATEIGLIKSEIEVALSELDSWVKPTKKSNTALNIPCWSTTQRDPLGVVLVMGAWNYPVQLTLAPMIGAIAGGNCIVVKPGSYAPNTSNVIANIIPKYLDQSAIRVVEGNRDVTTAILNQRFDKIFFTGSGFVGRVVARAAAEHLTPCVLELGGKSPCIIDKTAHIKHAVDRLCWAAFLNGGQTCVRPDFVLVHADVADEFFVQVQKTILSFYGEDPQKTEWFGRCINDSAFKRLSALVDENKEKIVIGGKYDAKDKFITPTVFDFGKNEKEFSSSSLMQDELFGPLVPCLRFTSTQQCIDLVKDLPTGKPLALYAFGRDSNFVHAIKHQTSSGGLCINDCIMHLANHNIPFGGVGSSGMGNYHGKYSFDTFTHEKAVLEKSPALDESIFLKHALAARFPPYRPYKQFLVKTLGVHFVEKLINLPIPLFWMCIKVAVAYVIMTMLGFRITKS